MLTITTIFAAIASLNFVKIIIAYLLIESVVIAAIRIRLRQQDWYAHLPGHMAGLCLLFAVHAALSDAQPLAMVVALSGAFVAHSLDMRMRLTLSKSGSQAATQTG